jgi:hypothetical protein
MSTTARPIHLDLCQAIEAGGSRGLTVGEILEGLDGRSQAAAILLLSLPFLQPVPTLGLAYPLGLVIAGLGAALALGRKAWLPATLLRLPVRRELLKGMALVLGRLHRVLPSRSRLPIMTSPLARVAAGASLFCAGVVLFLPIPLPMSNFVPAVAILLLALGLVERDGVLLLAGHVANALSVFGLVLAWGAMRAGGERALAFVLA